MKPKSGSQLRITKCSIPGSVLSILPLLLMLGGMFLPAKAFAARPNPIPDSTDKDVRYVDCGSANKLINSINNALGSLDPSENNTVYVRGVCKENVAISGFDRLQLIAQNGASITDASGDTAAVLSIDNSTRVSVQGFTINGSGPNAQTEVIDCTFSYCAFSGNTVQGGSDGVDVSRGARASFSGDLLQNNNNGAGIFVGQNGFVLAIGVTSQKMDRARTSLAASCRSMAARFRTISERASSCAWGARSTCLLRPSREMEATASTCSTIPRFSWGSREMGTEETAVPLRITRARALRSRTFPSLTSFRASPMW